MAAEARKPLTLKEQGSFFVGGETKTLNSTPAGGEITVNQMYVQYQIPASGVRHVAVVMVHGCCLSSKTWETTPDGRMGWGEYFVRKNHGVYLADQVSRARSGFDPTSFNALKAGTVPSSQLPNIRIATHQTAWFMFRLGPSFNMPFPDGQFPIEAVDELYKQMIPDLNSTLHDPNPTWANMAALAVKLKGAVLIGHSESGFFPELAALIDPVGVRGIVSIEMPCAAMTTAQISTLAVIPTLIMFGDHLDERSAPSLDSCQKFVQQLKDGGGNAVMMSLPKLGIKGNSHMLMQDRNNLQLADLILDWIHQHVEGEKAPRRSPARRGR
jgi:hypothetical protein